MSNEPLLVEPDLENIRADGFTIEKKIDISVNSDKEDREPTLIFNIRAWSPFFGVTLFLTPDDALQLSRILSYHANRVTR